MEHRLIGSSSKKEYNSDEAIWFGNQELLEICTDTLFDTGAIKTHEHSLWRYQSFLPVHQDHIISLGEGFTPMQVLTLAGRKVHVKQEQLFPSGSYKDRGASVLISKAKSLGVQKVVQDSSGNAGCAIAAYSAAAGISSDIYVPSSTSSAKLAQMRMYGANLILVDGDREATAAAALKAAGSCYYASHSYNPYFFEGTKTFAYEVCEQLNWKSPDVVIVPAGNGTLLIGCYIGFLHLLQSDIITKMPKLVAVQSEGCAPLYEGWRQGLDGPAKIITSPTMAEGIAIADPVRGRQMLDVVRKSNGAFVTVNETEITHALRLCSSNGYYIEPTSAATIAGVIKASDMFDDGIWVSLFSGHGLKSTEKMMALLNQH